MNTWGEDAACSSVSPKIWGTLEESVDEALGKYKGRTKRHKAYQRAIPALAICQTCPVIAACAKWAKESRYSGIAGGRIYIKGTVLLPPIARTTGPAPTKKG